MRALVVACVAGLAGLASMLGCAAPRLAVVRYDVRTAAIEPCVLDVDVAIDGGAEDLLAEVPGVVVSNVSVEDRGGRRAIAGKAGRFHIACVGSCTAHYRLDLSATALAYDDAIEIALRADRDVLAPVSTWLLHPSPWHPGLGVDVTVHTPNGVRFSSGLARSPKADTYTLVSQDLATAGYAAFGAHSSTRVAVTGGVIDVAILTGARRADDAMLAAWVRETAGYLDAVFGRFPTAHAQVFIVPVPGSDDVEFGRTLPAGGPTTVIVLGGDAEAAALRRDSILTHELFHLGVPSFWHEGRWLDEGLATYYEPVLRARAGVLTDRELWREFANGMPRGVAQPGEAGLVAATEHDRVYWGGAAFALRADVEIRRRTRGARSLDDGLRAALDGGGDATQVWSLERFLETIDAATGLDVTRKLYAAIAPPAANQEARGLDAVFSELGVHAARAGGVTLLDDAPFAATRRQIAVRRMSGR